MTRGTPAISPQGEKMNVKRVPPKYLNGKVKKELNLFLLIKN